MTDDDTDDEIEIHEVIDLKRNTLADLAAAPAGTLVYTGVAALLAKPDLTLALRLELDKRLRDRGHHIRDLGGYYLEIEVLQSAIPPPLEGACVFCLGNVWCGRCRRCGNRHLEPFNEIHREFLDEIRRETALRIA